MSYTVYLAPAGRWLAIDFEGVVHDADLVAARTEAARVNPEGHVRDFILDFSRVRELVLQGQTVDDLGALDRSRAAVLPEGRCALVARREVVVIAAKYLAMVSPLELDYRLFQERADAEAWLRGEAEPPPPLPRARRS